MDLLIAHGSEVSRRKLAQTLAGPGVRLVQAGDGADALDLLTAAGAPRLALIEWDLPGCDGPELCRLLRAYRDVGPPYIILVARSDQRLAEGLEAGADDCIHTPADADEMRARINVGRRFVELPWERVTREVGSDAQLSSERDPRAAPVLHAQRSPDDEGPDGDDGAFRDGRFELTSLLVAH